MAGLASPFGGSFSLGDSGSPEPEQAPGGQSPLIGGAENDAAIEILRKFLHPGLKGEGWTSMLAALAAGDQVNWDNARSAFDQLYISTARGVYLDKRAGEQGYRRPGDVGMSDDLFRQLAIVSKTSKLTQDALLQVLEVYYGRDTVRARAVSVGASPFVLADEDDLQLLLDGREEITVTFHQEDFSKIWLATGLEAAIVITRALRKAGSHAFAVSDGDHITIYSGRLGLGSSIEVLGGTAQVQFLFPSTKQTLYDQPRRVLVAQTSDEVDIVIPATTQAVGRSPRSASYGVTEPGPGLWLGPYVFDPKQGLALTSTEALVDIGLEANRQYAVLALTVSGGDLTPANRFPDTEGFLVFNFGWDEVVGPVRYYGRLSGNTLKLDYDFVFRHQVLAGTKVHLLSQRAPYQPPRLLNGFYATASGTGRQAASIAIDETVAAGTKVKLTVVYPGDRGLGAEGFPDHGDKLSDKVYVWAGSESEVASAKLPAKAI